MRLLCFGSNSAPRLSVQLLLLGAVLAICGNTTTAFAAEPKPSFMQPDVLRAAAAMQLTEEQKPLFRAAVTEFFSERMEAFNLLTRRHNQSNIKRKMKGKTSRLFKNMDKQVAAFLTPDQIPMYEVYRETLKANLRG